MLLINYKTLRNYTLRPLTILFSILLPLTINLITTQVIIYIAHKKELFDAQDHRKTHTGNIPRLGGIGIFLTIIISVIIFFLILKEHISLTFYLATTLIFLSGIVDDFKPVKPIIKLIAQITAALTLVIGGNVFSHVYIPFAGVNLDLGIFGYILTFVWVIGVTNAINLLDGMDGQAGGVSFFASLAIGIISLLTGNFQIAIICFMLCGSLIGFLNYNLPPAKIFMGDSGSLTLGFFLGALPLTFSSDILVGKMVLVSIAVLIIPIFDVFAAIIRRKMEGKSFFTPDRGHIHHKFMDFTSLNVKQILIVVFSLSIVSGLIAILFIQYPGFITDTLLFINVFIHLGVFGFLHKRKKNRG